jgi:hypothetical protein
MKLFFLLNLLLTESFLFKTNLLEKQFSTRLFNNRRDYSPYRNKYYEQMIKKLNRNQTERDLTMINNNIFEENLNLNSRIEFNPDSQHLIIVNTDKTNTFIDIIKI